jgi:hypothetical protein
LNDRLSVFSVPLRPGGRIELMHMIRKGQLMMEGGWEMSFADQFYALDG